MFNFDNAVYYKDPWPHIIIEDFINDTSTLNVLCNNNQLTDYMAGVYEPAVRIDLEEKDLTSTPDVPEEIILTLSILRQSKELIKVLEDNFLEHLIEVYPSRDKDYFTNLINIRAAYGSNNKCDDRTDIKGIHLDNGDKIYTGMIYLKEYSDTTVGSNIVLQSYDNYGNITSEKEIEYKSNVALFWPTTYNSWHYVQPRNPSPNNLRRFINYVAEGVDSLHNYTNKDFNNVKKYEWKRVNHE